VIFGGCRNRLLGWLALSPSLTGESDKDEGDEIDSGGNVQG
jgi:hypothetical protein